MNKKIMSIITILIILLSIVLAVVFIDYLISHRPSNVKTPYKPVSQVSGEKTNDIVPVATPSGEEKKESGEIGGEVALVPPTEVLNETKPLPDEKETVVKLEETEPVKEPTQQVVDEKENTFIPNTIIEIGDNKTQEPIISSSTETSNQEKQEVLNELDSALQGLLEAVGKVPTVDEQKLDASLGSEVQP